MFTHFQHINTPLLAKLGTSEDLACIECLFQCFHSRQGNPVVYKTSSMDSNQVVSLNQQTSIKKKQKKSTFQTHKENARGQSQMGGRVKLVKIK